MMPELIPKANPGSVTKYLQLHFYLVDFLSPPRP